MIYVLYFFFFKQKTAYEMRISDWSSDVCSSDLGVVGEQDQCGKRRRTDRVALGHRLGCVAHRVERIGDVADLRRQLRHLGDAAELGRAACRERVCQDV